MTEPMRAPARRPPMAWLGLLLAGAAAALLIGSLLFAFATADARGAGSTDRFRLLGQAANPFIALLTLSATLVIVRSRQGLDDQQTASGTTLGLAAAVSVAVILLALNGVLIDLTGNLTGLFKVSALVSRLGTIALSAFALHLAGTAPPKTPAQPTPAEQPTPPAQPTSPAQPAP